MNTKRKFLSNIFLLLACICMMVIFYLSSQNGKQSTQVSDSFIATYVQQVLNVTPESYDFISHLTRKFAHFTAYFTLGIMWVMHFITKGEGNIKSYICAFVFSALYAVSDEFHQLFIPGRDGNINDVLLDCLGVITGLVCVMIIMLIIKKITNKKSV